MQEYLKFSTIFVSTINSRKARNYITKIKAFITNLYFMKTHQCILMQITIFVHWSIELLSCGTYKIKSNNVWYPFYVGSFGVSLWNPNKFSFKMCDFLNWAITNKMTNFITKMTNTFWVLKTIIFIWFKNFMIKRRFYHKIFFH